LRALAQSTLEDGAGGNKNVTWLAGRPLLFEQPKPPVTRERRTEFQYQTPNPMRELKRPSAETKTPLRARLASNFGIFLFVDGARDMSQTLSTMTTSNSAAPSFLR
jgi:hypothetical protein